MVQAVVPVVNSHTNLTRAELLYIIPSIVSAHNGKIRSERKSWRSWKMLISRSWAGFVWHIIINANHVCLLSRTPSVTGHGHHVITAVCVGVRVSKYDNNMGDLKCSPKCQSLRARLWLAIYSRQGTVHNSNWLDGQAVWKWFDGQTYETR